jgi:hypothetical protein
MSVLAAAAETGFGQASALVGLAAFVSRNLPPFSSIYSSPPALHLNLVGCAQKNIKFLMTKE